MLARLTRNKFSILKYQCIIDNDADFFLFQNTRCLLPHVGITRGQKKISKCGPRLSPVHGCPKEKVESIVYLAIIFLLLRNIPFNTTNCGIVCIMLTTFSMPRP